MVLVVIAFFIAFSGTQDPNTRIDDDYVVCAVPRAAHHVRAHRHERCIMGDLDLIAIQLAAIWGLSWLSAKIYRTGVLMYGKHPTLKELWKAMKAYGI